MSQAFTRYLLGDDNCFASTCRAAETLRDFGASWEVSDGPVKDAVSLKASCRRAAGICSFEHTFHLAVKLNFRCGFWPRALKGQWLDRGFFRLPLGVNRTHWRVAAGECRARRAPTVLPIELHQAARLACGRMFTHALHSSSTRCTWFRLCPAIIPPMPLRPLT